MRSRPHSSLRRLVAVALPVLLLLALPSCGRKSTEPGPPSGPARGYFMGFNPSPPSNDFDLFIASILMWSERADAALLISEPPWDSLLAGVRPDSLVTRQSLPLARFFRDQGMRLVVSIDPTNGLDRSSDAAPLVKAGRSLTEPAIQQLYRRYVAAMDTVLDPDHLGFSSETNLVRLAAPAPLYAAVVQVANDCAADVRALDPDVVLFSTVQVETAWGRLQGSGLYEGIAPDLAAFSYAQVLGLSSYPYLGGYDTPEEIPLDYFARVGSDAGRPVMMIEGGWPSVTVDTLQSSPDEQARYVRRQAAILDQAGAVGWFQILFNDIDLAAWTPPIPPSLPLFTSIGLVTATLAPKPALARWDSVYALPRR